MLPMISTDLFRVDSRGLKEMVTVGTIAVHEFITLNGVIGPPPGRLTTRTTEACSNGALHLTYRPAAQARSA